MAIKYSKFKIFHFKEKLDSLPEDNPVLLPPVHIRIKPTNFCAHHCWYCAYRADNLQLGKDMLEKDFIPREKMMEIIDDCVDMEVKAITFSGGGDPFYYPYLLDTVRRLSQTKIHFASLTNGQNLKGEIAEVFAHYGTWIRISTDGWDNKSYAEYRGVKEGAFSTLMQNMENFKKLNGKCYLGINFNVDFKNASHIYDFAKRVKDAGADSLKISPCIVSNSGEECNEYHRTISEEAGRQIAMVKSALADNHFEVFDAYHMQLESFAKDYHWCPYLQILMVIGADLNIYPCQDKAYNLDEALLGNISHMRFKDWWFMDKRNFFKIVPSKVCNHHCVANEKNEMILEYLDTDKKHLGFV